MAHKSESVSEVVEEKFYDLSIVGVNPNIEFIILPRYTHEQAIPKEILFEELDRFLMKSNENSTIAILTSPIAAASFCSQMASSFHLKLWIAVKSEKDLTLPDALPQNHSALLIITRYSGSLKHTKTRIAYTYCPECDRTTKDYGGKKHLYDPYGTLMSDVWRDISISSTGDLQLLIDRLKDLFGLPIYQKMNIYDLRETFQALDNQRQYQVYENRQINEFKFEGIGGSRLLNLDCVHALNNIPENSVDFCFADPPYNINKKYEGWDDGIDIQNYFEWCDRWLTGLANALKPGRTLAVLNIPQWCIRHFKHLNNILDYQDWIVWEGLSLPVRMIMPAHYSILCFSKGKPRQPPGLTRNRNSLLENVSLNTLNENYCKRASCINKRNQKRVADKSLITNLWWDIHRLKHNSRRVDHPCQLPPSFMYRLISLFTNEGEVVLDPFNGAGTSSLTSAQLKRKYVGIELSDYYNKIALRRHEELESGLDPFRKTESVPKAKNSHVTRLQQQKYEVSKKTLQLEVKQISERIGRVANREDILKNSQYPIEYFDNYFINWGEVTAAVRSRGMTEYKPESPHADDKAQQIDFDFGDRSLSGNR